MSDAMRGHAIAGGRVAYLDGLRGVAILIVVGFHYFTCFQSLMPYGNAWAAFPLFRWGFHGVHLFFAISGFVIAMTLERCASADLFVVRRFARLWPTMLLCSVLTYATLTLLPSPWPQSPANFLPSLTFIDGQVWNKLFPGPHMQWIDVAYWSLFVEVRFYAIAGLLWFAWPRRFAAAYFGASTIIVAAYALAQGTPLAPRAELLQWAFAAKHLPWFGVGLSAYLLARGDTRAGWRGAALAAAQALWLAAAGDAHTNVIVFAMVVALLILPGRVKWLRRLFGAPALTAVGASSYSLYLLHQYAGLAIIRAVARALDLSVASSLALALAIGAIMLWLARQIYRHWECPMNTRITRAYEAWRCRTRHGSTMPAAAQRR